jgi:hypothetical protein
MKTLKLILTIIKNLFLIIIEEIIKIFTIPKRRKWAVIIIIILILTGGGYKIWKYYRPDPNDPNISLAQAAKIGEVTTHKLLVEIENPKCPPAIANGCYERGDIVLIKPGDFEFSDAEKEGFLILRMDLTEKQSELLVRSLDKGGGGKGPDGQPNTQQLKMRRCGVDLSKIGIGNDDQKGREVEGRVYKWDIISEKR